MLGGRRRSWVRHRSPGPSRRAVLGVAVLALVGGCRSKRRPVPARTDPDLALSASVRADEAGLIASYDTAMLAFPALAPALVPLREQHEEHLVALQPRGSRPPASAPPPAAPADPTAAVRSLVATERAAAAARIADCLAASSRLAPLLASIGASEAAHAAALVALRPPG